MEGVKIVITKNEQSNSNALNVVKEKVKDRGKETKDIGGKLRKKLRKNN